MRVRTLQHVGDGLLLDGRGGLPAQRRRRLGQLGAHAQRLKRLHRRRVLGLRQLLDCPRHWRARAAERARSRGSESSAPPIEEKGADARRWLPHSKDLTADSWVRIQRFFVAFRRLGSRLTPQRALLFPRFFRCRGSLDREAWHRPYNCCSVQCLRSQRSLHCAPSWPWTPPAQVRGFPRSRIKPSPANPDLPWSAPRLAADRCEITVPTHNTRRSLSALWENVGDPPPCPRLLNVLVVPQE